MSRGTVAITSYEIDVMVGRIISDSTSEPANHEKPRVKPTSWKLVRRNGTRMVKPSQPHTTLGMPTKTSIAGWAIERAQRGAISDMKIARPTDNGVEMTAATRVTPAVPAMNGRMPKDAGESLGSQFVLRRLLSDTPEWKKICTPFQVMKPSSRKTSTITTAAAMNVSRRGRSSR